MNTHDLTFVYAVMGAGKSLDLLVKVYQHGRANVLIIKPAFDTRAGLTKIWSRFENARDLDADYVVGADEKIPHDEIVRRTGVRLVLVDEAHFFTEEQIRQLWKLSLFVPVVCYGLKSTFKGEPFKASALLFALADKLQSIDRPCTNCANNANFNMKVDDAQWDAQPDFQLGSTETYHPVCKACFYSVILNRRSGER